METQTKPVPVRKGSNLNKYNFNDMIVGTEWEISEQTEDGAKRVRRAASQFKIRNRLKWKISVKLHTDGKYRCKRLK